MRSIVNRAIDYIYRQIARWFGSGDRPEWKQRLRAWLKKHHLLKQRHILEIQGVLSARVIRGNGKIEKLGVIAKRKVTTAFVNHLVDSLQNQTGTPIDTFKYHDSGTGTNAESNGNTTLQTACGEARDTGTQTEGASANIYKSVATHTYAGIFAITEHGLFSASSSGTLMDRSVFSAINVVSGDKIEFTYQLTCNAEA